MIHDTTLSGYTNTDCVKIALELMGREVEWFTKISIEFEKLADVYNLYYLPFWVLEVSEQRFKYVQFRDNYTDDRYLYPYFEPIMLMVALDDTKAHMVAILTDVIPLIGKQMGGIFLKREHARKICI